MYNDLKNKILRPRRVKFSYLLAIWDATLSDISVLGRKIRGMTDVNAAFPIRSKSPRWL